MSGYFEGWYLKHQNKGKTLALIPGRSDDHSFIQVVTDQCAYNILYPLSDYESYGLGKIGDNSFTKDGVHLSIHTEQLDLYGDISYTNLTPINGDIMGPFRFFSMECRHSIISMRHELSGKLSLNGTPWDFDHGYGYIEGDRGRSFPKSYTWIQSNDFTSDLSVTVAVAKIPFCGLHFWGCISIVRYRGKEYRLATYKGVKILKRTETEIELRQGKYRLCISVPKSTGHPLKAPNKGTMDRIIHEVPSCKAQFHFSENGHEIFDEISLNTSFEHVS